MKMLAKVLIFLPLAFLTGCLPDLTVTNLDVSAWQTDKKVVADIKNRGWEDAGQFLVYFDAEAANTTIIAQVSKKLDGLNKRTSLELPANFASEGSPPNANLANVRKIVVRVDAKNFVRESNENNNTMEKPVP